MPAPINLPASSDTDHLVNAIRQANDENRSLILMPGLHLTKPGHNQVIKIDENGLAISGSLNTGEYSTIKRPDNAIDLAASDSNFGLYFIPSAPTTEEIESIKTSDWKPYAYENSKTHVITTIEYAVIIRGKITIEDLEIDCNMGNQGVAPTIEKGKIEHSAMVGFAGNRYPHPTNTNRFIFVAFENVTINNVRLIRGGFADDIWISRGYFRPNIGSVSISNITSDMDNPVNPQSRINKRRATISFSGLVQKVEINNAKIYRLEAEEATKTHWQDLPGEALTPDTLYSYWQLKNILCESLDLAAKGKAIFLNADGIETSKSTNLYQVGGLIKNTVFNLLPQTTTLNRLNNPTFENVTWLFSAFQDKRGYFWGIYPRGENGELCSAKFIHNFFIVKGMLTINVETKKYALIHSESGPGNSVELEFINCSYDERFGREDLTYIGDIKTKGKWKFKIADFMDIPYDRALFINPPDAPRLIEAGIVEINIP